MSFLSLVASITQRATIVSELMVEYASIPWFGYGDALTGQVIVVSETDDPTEPTSTVEIDSSSGVSLTDGAGVIYANAVILLVTNANQINFTLIVAGAELAAALEATEDQQIPAFLEVRGTQGTQDILILKEPTIITKSASGLGPSPMTLTNILFNKDIDSLRGSATSLENYDVSEPFLPTLTMLAIIQVLEGDRSSSFWQLLEGTADPDDLEGQVQSTDAGRFWMKVGGL